MSKITRIKYCAMSRDLSRFIGKDIEEAMPTIRHNCMEEGAYYEIFVENSGWSTDYNYSFFCPEEVAELTEEEEAFIDEHWDRRPYPTFAEANS